MKANFIRVSKVARDNSSITKTKSNTRDCGSLTRNMVKVNKFGHLELFTMETGKMDSRTERVLLQAKMVINSLVTGKKIRRMANLM